MFSDLEVGLSSLSLYDNYDPYPFKRKRVLKDVDLMRKLDIYNAVDRPWSSLNYSHSSIPKTSYELISLNESSREYKEVMSHIKRNINSNSRYRVLVTKIKLNKNVYLWHQYGLKRRFKTESNPSTKVLKLFHGTKQAYVDSICKNNLNWRKVGSSRYLGNKYGTGVSFSPSFTYATQFPRGKLSGKRIMLLCDVLVKKRHHGNGSTRIPLKGYDATSSPNGQVLVKYEDNEFYPKYVIEYSLSSK